MQLKLQVSFQLVGMSSGGVSCPALAINSLDSSFQKECPALHNSHEDGHLFVAVFCAIHVLEHARYRQLHHRQRMKEQS